MSSLLQTHSKFYYGYVIDDTNYQINFVEGGPELLAELNPGSYSFEDFAIEIERALNDAGSFTYTVTTNRAPRTLTIVSSSAFDLLVSSGTNVGTSPFTLMGFTGSDRTGSTTYTGDSPSGSEYRPQFWLQNYISSEDWQQAADASINKVASGRVEVIKFGIEKFVQFQIKFITNITQNSTTPIRNDPQGLENARAFMQYITTRQPFEFMQDEEDADEFQTLAFDSSQDSQSGTGYKLKELYDKGAAGYFETVVLKFRLRE